MLPIGTMLVLCNNREDNRRHSARIVMNLRIGKKFQTCLKLLHDSFQSGKSLSNRYYMEPIGENRSRLVSARIVNQSIIMFIRCKRVMHIKYVAERFANWRQRKDQLVIKVSCHHQTNSLLSRYDCFDMKTKTEQKQKKKKKILSAL